MSFEGLGLGGLSFDIWAEIDLLLRLLAGMAAGIVVGWERTHKQRAAGIRTFGLVGLGTALRLPAEPVPTLKPTGT